MLDDERCILCTRCIRFTRDLAGDDALGIVNRGSYNTLSNYPGKPFDNNYTLNTADICPVGALTSKDFRFQMRVWFLKETKSLCTSCATGCNIQIGSRENKVYRYVPRENDDVNSCWMCDEGRLNYKWIGRGDRLDSVLVAKKDAEPQTIAWSIAISEIAQRITNAPQGSVAIIASARQTNEELYLLALLAKHCEALTDTVPRVGRGDNFLVHTDQNPNTMGATLTGFLRAAPGKTLPEIATGVRSGKIKTLIVFGEDVTEQGIDSGALAKLDTLIVSDILPNATTQEADVLLPGCAHAEKRGTFTNAKGRVQKFMKAIEPPGDARPEWEVLSELVSKLSGTAQPLTIESLFNKMAAATPSFEGLTWATLGDTGMAVTIDLEKNQ